MERQVILDQIIEKAGGEKNIGRHAWKPDGLLLAIKDQSVADLHEIENLFFVDSCKFVNGKLKVILKEEYRKETSMADNKKIAESILKTIGGADNVKIVQHCMTRLRVELKDKTVATPEDIKKIEGVIGCQEIGGQLQAVIGPNVDQVYSEFCKIANISELPAIDENLDDVPEKKDVKYWLSHMIRGLSDCITPLLPVLIVGGILQAIAIVLGPSMLNFIAEESDTYRLFNFAGAAAFYFFPVFIGYTGAKRFGGSVPIGMLLGAIMISPTFIEIVNAGEPFSVYGIPARLANYSSTILPMVILSWIMAKVYQWLKKVIPSMIQIMAVPVCTMLIMLPLAFCVVGPLGGYIGDAIIGGIVWIMQTLGIFGPPLYAIVHDMMKIAGMHLAMIPYMIQSMMSLGYEPLFSPVGTASTFAMVGTCLAFALKSKKSEGKGLGISCAIAALIGGVAEPGIYGICVRYKKPFIGHIIGCVLGSFYLSATHTYVYRLTATNVLSILGFISDSPSTFTNGIIGCAIAFVAAAVATYLIGFDETERNEE